MYPILPLFKIDMKKIFLVLLFALTALSGFTQNNRLNYAIAIIKFQNCYNTQKADSLYAMFSIQMKAALPVDKTAQMIKGLYGQLGALKEVNVVKETNVNTVYKGTFDKGEQYIVFPLNDKNELTGLFLQAVVEKAADATNIRQQQYEQVLAKVQRFYNERNADSLFSLFSPEMKSVLPIEKTRIILKELSTQIGLLKNTVIEEEAAEDMIYKGIFEKAEMNIVLRIDEQQQLTKFIFTPRGNAFTEPGTEATTDEATGSSNYNIKTQSGATIYGTLVLPEKSKPDVVLLIAGSGPTDRNCNSALGFGTNAFKMIADSLRKAGIASVRFDKRGVAESIIAAPVEAELRFDDYVQDVVSYIKKIREDGRFSKIFIVGHSEGSLVGMIAANKERVNGFVSVCGSGEAADKLLSRQFSKNIPGKAPEADSVLQQLKKGNKVTIHNKYLASLFRPSLQPYLSSWFAYDPQKEIKLLNIPVLILQGSTDMQVTENDAKLLKAAQPKARLVIITGMNHVLKNASADQMENAATYNNLTLPVNTRLTTELIGFCKQ